MRETSRDEAAGTLLGGTARRGRPAAPEASGAGARTVRVCMYTAESQRGHARYARDLLSALADAGPAAGVEVALVTSRDLAPVYRSTRYPIHAVLPPLADRSTFRTRLGWAASRVAHYVGRERTFFRWLAARPDLDVVHLQEYTPWLAPAHVPRLRRRGLAVVSTVHNIANHAHASRHYMRVSRVCWRSAWRSCSALVVHTEGLRDALAEELGPRRPPIFVTPHAVWEERAAPPVAPEPPAPGEPARLLFFGMVRPNKGLHVLLGAMGRLPGCTLTVAGEPESPGYFAGLRALIDAMPEGRVEVVDRFVGEGEIAGFFDRCHLVVLPYVAFASQSGVLHQALAHGRPVAATDVGGLGESVRRWGVGEVAAPGDPDALAAAVSRALEPSRYRAAALAVARVRGELTWSKMAEATLDVYRAVVA